MFVRRMKRYISLSVCLLIFGCRQLEVYSQLLVSCPDFSVSYHGSCYIFGFGQSMLFHQAETFCRDQHDSHVVHVDSKNESSFLKAYMSRLPSTENYWLGMSDARTEHEWRWTGSDSLVTVFDWAPGDPDNVATDEDCAIFWNHAGYKWADVPCGSFKAEPVCELSLIDESEIIG